MSSSIYAAFPLMALLTVIQTAVLPRFPILEMMPIIPFLVALSWGLLRGINEGLIWGFMAGIFIDLFSIVPVGVSALAFMGGITAVLFIQRILPISHFLLPALFAALATLIYLIIYFALLAVFGLGNLSVATSLLPLILLHAALNLPIYWLMRYTYRAIRPPRVEL